MQNYLELCLFMNTLICDSSFKDFELCSDHYWPAIKMFTLLWISSTYLIKGTNQNSILANISRCSARGRNVYLLEQLFIFTCHGVW